MRDRQDSLYIDEGHKKIHINRNIIDSNRKHGTNKPPVAVRIHTNERTKTPRKIEYGHEIDIYGFSSVIYRPEEPLSCGAKLWIETNEPVRVI